MKKIHLLLITLISVNLFSQNVNLRVLITKVERSSYSDCIGCGDTDPTWKIQSTHNGQGGLTYGPFCWHFSEMVNTIWDVPDFPIMSLTNTNATTFTLGLNDAFEKSCSNNNCTYEPYNFFTCFPSVNGDSRRCQNNSLALVNFRTSAPCQWITVVSPWCGDFRFEYSYNWSFNYAPTLLVQPAANTELCMGSGTSLSVAAGPDPFGWNMGLNYQWQISASSACPGSGWTDIVGATSSTFIPSQIPGTRLYRCKVTSNCNPDFSSNTTISNCSAVTYSPIGSPGDLPPDIVSGICGSTVLPGSTHVLGTLTPPNPGAVLGLSGHTWTATGGSPTSFTGPEFTWTAPVNPGTYTITLTYNDNCPQPDAIANACVVNVGSATCDFAYVATYGVDSAYRGGPDNPYKSLEYALSQLNGRKYVRMANGVYNEVNPLQLSTDLIIEGGYKVNGNIWSKNNSDSTTIICSGTEVISNDVAHRVGFISNGALNWRLQDLTIVTTDISIRTASGKGYSNYGIVVLAGSSNFEIVRCKIYSGDAAKGADGSTPAGSGGAGGGSAGGAGGNGSTTGCNGSGSPGSTGLPGNGGAAPGGGGSPCGGGGCNIFGCDASGCTGANGGLGSAGAAGSGYASGVRPLTPGVVSPYYIPAGQSPSGSWGFGGGSGGGGGGGDVGTCCTCGCGSGNPRGGNGGGGGGGGLPGSGGVGGGGSFGIYASGAGTTGTLTTTLITAGNFGLGGDGAAGQPGSAGGSGGAGFNHGGCDGGEGGDGGSGGTGGAGGRGQDGANGLNQPIVSVGGASISGSSTGVPNTFVVGIDYLNAKACINSEIGLTKSSGVWTFPSGLSLLNDLRDYPAGFPVSSYNASSSPVLVYTTTPSVEYDLTINGNVYSKYLTLADDNRALPSIQNFSPTICINGIDSLSATHWGTEVEYDWKIYQGTNATSPLYQSTLPSPSINFFGFTPGIYVVRYRVRESCCGWSKAVFDTIRIVPEPTIFNAYGGGYYCPGSAGAIVNLSGSEPGVTYILYFNGNPVDTFVGTGGPIAFEPQTGVGNYTVEATRFAGCISTMFGTVSIGQYPQPQQFSVSGGDTICAQGATISATVLLSGSELGVNYQLIRNGNLPTGAPLPGTGLALSFTGITVAGVYTVTAVNPTTTCQTDMTDSAVIVVAPNPTAMNVVGGGAFCDGAAGVVIGLDSSETGFVYQLLQGGVLPSVPSITGTGAPISFAAVTVSGYYKVKATSIYGCDGWMSDSAWVTKLSNPVVAGVVATDVRCFGDANGSIVVSAFTQNGTLSYSIDSAASYQSSNTFNSLTSASYNVSVKDDSGCVASYAANPVKVATPPLLILSLHGTNPDCFGTSTGSVTVSPSGGTSPYSYSWNTVPPQNSFTIDKLTGNNTYAVTVTDGNQCSSSGSVAITEPDEVVVTVLPVDVRCFEGNTGQVTISTAGGIPPYDYFLNGIYQDDSIFTGLTAGTYIATSEDVNHCKGSATFSLSQPVAFTVDAGPDVLALIGETIQLNGNAFSVNGIIGYFWSPDFHISCLACQNPMVTPDTTTTYILMAMDGDSCLGFDSVVVEIRAGEQYFIPTAFTPNADGRNDFFEVNMLGAIKIVTAVFNRWGERVYYNPNQHNGILNNGDAWDGKKDGKLLPFDTYVYQIEVDYANNTSKTYTGTITLMK